MQKRPADSIRIRGSPSCKRKGKRQEGASCFVRGGDRKQPLRSRGGGLPSKATTSFLEKKREKKNASFDGGEKSTFLGVERGQPCVSPPPGGKGKMRLRFLAHRTEEEGKRDSCRAPMKGLGQKPCCRPSPGEKKGREGGERAVLSLRGGEKERGKNRGL